MILGWNICTYGWIYINSWALKKKCIANTRKPLHLLPTKEKANIILRSWWHLIIKGNATTTLCLIVLLFLVVMVNIMSLVKLVDVKFFVFCFALFIRHVYHNYPKNCSLLYCVVCVGASCAKPSPQQEEICDDLTKTCDVANCMNHCVTQHRCIYKLYFQQQHYSGWVCPVHLAYGRWCIYKRYFWQQHYSGWVRPVHLAYGLVLLPKVLFVNASFWCKFNK
jgi:hypothetical protein